MPLVHFCPLWSLLISLRDERTWQQRLPHVKLKCAQLSEAGSTPAVDQPCSKTARLFTSVLYTGKTAELFPLLIEKRE